MTVEKASDDPPIARYADRFAALGTESRLRIMRLLLTTHPTGMVVGDIGKELSIPNSTLSHHLEKLKNEDLVNVRREGTFLWYSANTDALREVLEFLYAECCTRSQPQGQQPLSNCSAPVQLVTRSNNAKTTSEHSQEASRHGERKGSR